MCIRFYAGIFIGKHWRYYYNMKIKILSNNQKEGLKYIKNCKFSWKDKKWKRVKIDVFRLHIVFELRRFRKSDWAMEGIFNWFFYRFHKFRKGFQITDKYFEYGRFISL